MDAEPLRAALLEWYRPRRHAYAWRRGRRDPYRVLVSEVMLQQTQAARVEPIFEAFLGRFPDVGALAGGSRADVLRAWEGLGYNRRAVALHDAARTIAREHGGRVPRDPEVLRRLPGIGPYTAAAIAAIGHGRPIAAIETNVRRVCARVFRGREPDELPEATIAADAAGWLDGAAPGTWHQAVMDLGRLVCRPLPRCETCPLAAGCRFRATGRTGRSSTRPQGRFEGSTRQVRGAVIGALRRRSSLDPAGLTAATGHDPDRVAAAIDRLVAEGLLERTRAGRLRLPRR
jgi:A/G-specific adenine glycosylase